MQTGMIFYMVEMGNIHFFTYSWSREDAKRQAFPWVGSDPDRYIVTPLTEPGDRIHLSLTVAT